MVPGFKARTNRHCLEVLFRRYNLTLALALGRRAGSTSGLTFVDSPKAMDLTKMIRQLIRSVSALAAGLSAAEVAIEPFFVCRVCSHRAGEPLVAVSVSNALEP